MSKATVTLVVATTVDPASIGPADSLLAMSGWQPGPSLQGAESFTNKDVRLIKIGNHLVLENHLDRRWEEATGEVVNDVVFLSKHVASSTKPALTIHPIGTPQVLEGEELAAGGRARWAAPPNPRIGSWLKLLKDIAESHNLVPEFEITLEATHHGPEINSPTMFVEIGSTEECWKRQDAAQAIGNLVWQGLGLGGGAAVGNWGRNNDMNKVLLGIGGGHYVPRHMDMIRKSGAWVGHLLSGYSLLMEEPKETKAGANASSVGGSWRETIIVAFEATKSAFPGGEILAHLDSKSFKGWQRNAVTSFLAEQNIKIGKPADFSIS